MCHKETLVELKSFEAVGQITTKQPSSYQKSKVNCLAFFV